MNDGFVEIRKEDKADLSFLSSPFHTCVQKNTLFYLFKGSKIKLD